MNREKLNRHKQNKRELALIERQLDRLYERLENVETVSGKVTKSGDDFPYIEEHVTVQMAEPKVATAIKDQIRAKESRRRVLQGKIREVNNFIAGLPEGVERRIMEMVYLDDMMFFASTFSSKMQIDFLKVAWGISPVLHFLRRHSFRCRRGAVAGIQSLLVTDM